MSDDTDRTEDDGQPGSGAMAPKSKRDALREKFRKAASDAGPPTEDWATAELPDGVTRK